MEYSNTYGLNAFLMINKRPRLNIGAGSDFLKLRLEREFQPHAHRTAEGLSLGWIQEGCRLPRRRDRAAVDRPGGNEVPKVKGVQSVDHLNPVFQIRALGKLELLGNRQIQVVDAGRG